MPSCAVISCRKKSNKFNMQKDGISFHLFPKYPHLKRMWTEFCKNAPSWEPSRTSTICSAHFLPSQFQYLAGKRRKLVEDAIPVLLAPPTSANTDVQENEESITIPPQEPETATKEKLLVITQNAEIKKLKQKVEHQALKIKRLHSQTRYLKNKVASLEEILKSLNNKANKEQKFILQNIELANE
ncbi:hypothetical protein ABMA28_016718 [Loxostege sticticalis]|uniref:THAP-type domain-containing protein n=1 Tax=Loxostege sticticalis TaxID=481309 RepID=A0ABD0T7B7_LOXSC